MKDINDIIYGFIIGDATGVPFEFEQRDEFYCDKMVGCNEDSFHQVPIGTWSDDTSLMLCIMDALSQKKNMVFDKYKENCVNWLYEGKFTADNSYPFDIGGSCRLGIIELKTGEKNYKADRVDSNGNGGLMRILPVAFLELDDEDIMEYIKLFNACSHNHIISHVGCLIYVKIIKSLLNGKKIEEALDELNMNEEYILDNYRRIWDKSILNADRKNIRSTGYVVDTLEAAIWSLANSNNYEEAIFNAVNLGEDTDTIAAITGAMAACIYDISEDMKKNIRNQKLIDKTIKGFIKNIKKRNY